MISLIFNKEKKMLTSKLDEEKIFSKINPLIEESMTSEQKRETKRLIKEALPKATKKIIKTNFHFWFFKLFYITFYLGSEQRSKIRKFSLNTIYEALVVSFSSIIVISFAIAVITAIFLALYYIKSLIGIDLFEGHIVK